MLSHLRATLARHEHAAITLWSVGNELNGAWTNWVGDSCASGTCLFATNVEVLYAAVNELCVARRSNPGRPAYSGFTRVCVSHANRQQ